MPRGRKPDAPGLQELKGNPGKRKRVASAPGVVETTPSGALKPLSLLTTTAKAVWQSVGPDLERMGFLRPTDRNAFARYCDAVARYWAISKQLRMEGQTYTSTSAHGDLRRVNPLFLIEERLAKRLEGLEDRFGLTPATRQQIMMRLAQQQPQLPFKPKADAETAAPAPVESPIGLLGPATRH